VTKTPPKDVGASVRARLQRLARARSEDFQLLLTRYANERLLFHLAASRHKSQFVLKGAALFTLWTGTAHRTTRDLDFLGFGEPDSGRLREIWAEVLALDVPDDGVHFDLRSLSVNPIREVPSVRRHPNTALGEHASVIGSVPLGRSFRSMLASVSLPRLGSVGRSTRSRWRCREADSSRAAAPA